MASLLIGPGLGPLLIGPGLGSLLLGSTAVVLPPATPVWSGLLMSDVSPGNLSGWWDASSLAGMTTSAGTTPAYWNGNVYGLIDKSGGGHPALISATGLGNRAPSGPLSIARCVGNLGGIGGYKTNSAGTYWPAMDETVSTSVASVDLRASVAWTLTTTWSRPNLYQDSTYDGSQPVIAGSRVLLSVGGTSILSLGNTATDTLTLFPGGAAVSLSTGLPRMFTHSVTLVNTPGSGVTAYFDDAQVATGVANPITAAGSLALPSGNAQMIFHECGIWSKTLTSAELVMLHGPRSDAAAKRWVRGARRSYIFLNFGQSNWNAAMSDIGSKMLMQDQARYHLGELACWIGSNDGYGNILNNVLTGTSTDAVAANLPLGSGASITVNFVNSLPSDMRAMIAGQLEDWTESASVSSYSDNIQSQLQAERELTIKLRALVGVNFPRMSGYAVPYSSSDSGMQGMVELNATMAATSADKSYIVITQQLDTLPRTASYDPSTGAYGANATGGVVGDIAHRDPSEWPRIIRRMAASVAWVVQQTAASPLLTVWPTGLPTVGGPKVSAAVYEGISQNRTNAGTPTDTLLVTVTHDPGYAATTGCDFQLDGSGKVGYLDPTGVIRPSAAATGCGWVVIDGGTPASPTSKVVAIACERVDATHLRVTLASRLSSASQAAHSNAKLLYGYGMNTNANSLPSIGQFGRGNAIYDNYAGLAKPAGWNPVGDFGPTDNMPLATIPFGLPLA